MKTELQIMKQLPLVLPELFAIKDDPNGNYNLEDAFHMQLGLEFLQNLEVKIEETKQKLLDMYGRTILEYLEAGITTSDNLFIELVKQGRAKFQEEKAREQFPEACKNAETIEQVFDEEMFQRCEPEMFRKYQVPRGRLTLTALREMEELTDEQLELVITRGPATYKICQKFIEGQKEAKNV
jgi:hypothetical protein